MADASAEAGNRTPGSDPGSVSSTLLERLKARRPEGWRRPWSISTARLSIAGAAGRACGRATCPTWSRRCSPRSQTHIVDFHRRRPDNSFTGWMRTITRNKVCDRFRQRQGQPQARAAPRHQAALAENPESRQTSEAGNAHPGADAAVLPQALELVRAEFENRTWEAFWRAVIDGQLPAHVAKDLGMSVQAVYKAKSRVLRRLRGELGELL